MRVRLRESRGDHRAGASLAVDAGIVRSARDVKWILDMKRSSVRGAALVEYAFLLVVMVVGAAGVYKHLGHKMTSAAHDAAHVL